MTESDEPFDATTEGAVEVGCLTEAELEQERQELHQLRLDAQVVLDVIRQDPDAGEALDRGDLNELIEHVRRSAAPLGHGPRIAGAVRFLEDNRDFCLDPVENPLTLDEVVEFTAPLRRERNGDSPGRD